MLKEVKSVARSWIDRVEHGGADRSMIWMVNPLVRVNVSWIVGDDCVGPHPSDLSHDSLAELVAGSQLPVFEIEEVDLGAAGGCYGVALLSVPGSSIRRSEVIFGSSLPLSPRVHTR